MKWAAAIVLVLIVGLLFRLNLLVYAMYVLAGVLLLNRYFTRSWIEGLSAAREGGGKTLEQGQSLEFSVTVRNASRFTIPWLLMEDSLPRPAIAQVPPRIRAEGPRVKLTRLGPGGIESLTYRVSFLMRGYYQIGPAWLETGDVFGLHRRYRVTAEPQFVQVLPKVLALQGYNLASRRPIGTIRIAHRLFEDPTRLASIRPYQQGDPLNRIHWRATARTGALHSRVYENSRVAGATFLLDFHEQNYRGDNGPASAELAVIAVASIANAVHLMGEQIGMISNGRDAAERIRAQGWTDDFTSRGAVQRRVAELLKNFRWRPVTVPTGKGDDRFSQILQLLARLEHTDGLNFAELVKESVTQIRRDATVVPVLTSVTAEGAVALGELVRRGFAVTAVVVSAGGRETPDWARPPDWADLLLAQGVDFRFVNGEDSIVNLCAEGIVR
jgi:uncharacterized protein (DUF58 family)